MKVMVPVTLLVIMLASGYTRADITFYTDEPNWITAITGVETLETIGVNVAKADEVQSPPTDHQYLGDVLTFRRANTGLSWSFSIETIEENAQFIFNDHLQHPLFKDRLSIGNVDTHEDDDWKLQIIDSPPLYACAFDVGNNDDFTVDEFLDVFGQDGSLLGRLKVKAVLGLSFFGVVSDTPIGSLVFDEDPVENDICIGNFQFALKPLLLYHVDGVNGDNSNNGLTPGTAFATIQKGIDTARDGDTVIVYPCRYTENINLLGKNIMLTSTRPISSNIVDGTIIDGSVSFRGTEGPSCTLTGFNIDGYIVGFDRLIDPNGENHTHATISYCILENILTPCEAVIQACDGIISNCLIANIYPGCLVPWRVPQIMGCHGLIKNCTIADIPDGIEVMEGGTCTIENSILYPRAWIFVSSGATLNISYCDLHYGLNGIEGGGTVNWGPGNIDTDPFFARLGDSDTQGDYHLLKNSTCIDAGDPGYIPGPGETDLDGNPRIGGNALDMGAYEFQGPFKRYYYVDGINGDNTNDGLTRETAFKTIQRGINIAEDYDTVLVWPGVYNEEIGFWGDAITVKSAADAAVVETDYGYAFSFFSAEGPDTVLSNFVIRNSQYGIYLVNGSSPTLSNLTIVNNDFGISAYNGSDPDISNCILWGNYYGDLFRDPAPLEAKYSFVQEEIEANLVAYWKLDGDAVDSVSSNDGTIYGATLTTGQVGGALDFDGVDDYIEVPNTNGAFDLAIAWTLAAWVKPSVPATGYVDNPIIWKRTEGTTDDTFVLAWGSETGYGLENVFYTKLERASDGEDLSLHSGSHLPNNWYYVVAMYDGNSLKIYVNGTLENSRVIGTVVAYTGPGPLTIGSFIWYESPRIDWFEGTIDEVRIYNRALSPEKIQAMYQAGLAGHEYGPLFADANGGDYHLLSERGRYRATTNEWLLDNVTSPCIDGGDPSVDPSNERMPNGGRINMGAYGNTAYASMSEWPLAGDINRDGVVNFEDFAIVAEDWLKRIRPVITVEDDTEDSYSCEGYFDVSHPCSDAVDEDWDTYALTAYAGATSYIYENYTIPPGVLMAEFTIKYGHTVPVTPGYCTNVTDYWDGSTWRELNCTALTNQISTLTVEIPDDALSGSTLQLRTPTWKGVGIPGSGDGMYYEGKVIWHIE